MRVNPLVNAALLVLLYGCAHGGSSSVMVPAPVGAAVANGAVASTAAQGTSDRPIGVDDVLDIQVFQVTELSKVVKVAPDGQISYPLLGLVPAAGKTPRELVAHLEAALRGYMREPRVTIEVKQYGTPPVYVIGAVEEPGAFMASDRNGLTVMRAVALAKGMKSTAAGGRVVLMRADETGARVHHTLNVNDIVKGKTPDVALVANDILYVPTNNEKAILQGTVDALLRVVSFRGIF